MVGDAFTGNGGAAPGLLGRLPAIRKVVIVRASRIGDFVCATPAFRALRRALPETEITLIALPWARELVARSPSLDRFEPFPGFPGIAEQFFAARAAVAFFQRMQAERFDLAIQLHGSGIYSNPFTLLLGARATAGFRRAEDPPGLLDADLPFPHQMPEVRRPLALMTFLGAPPLGEQTEFPLWSEDRAAARRLLVGLRRPLLGLHPAGTDATKRWPPERFAAAARMLLARFGGTAVVLAGSGERVLASEVAAAIGDAAVNLAGRTTLPELGGVIAELDLLLTNDSGPAHIGYALGTPTVTVFGGTDPAEWQPTWPGRYRSVVAPVPCRPCNQPTCSVGYRCLDAVSVTAVVDAATEIVRGVSGP